MSSLFAGAASRAVVCIAAVALGANGRCAENKPPAPLGYETSTYELSPAFPNDAPPWSAAEAQRELARRIAHEKTRHEIDVDYYRIGHTLAFPLPVAHRPARAELPPGIATMAYPWMIWLSWELEERWRLLHYAWRERGDAEAGRLLQQELAALATWDRIIENNDQPGLATAHIAGCLAQALADDRGWEPRALADARAAATALIERDVAPWYQKQWGQEQPFDHRRLVNIPVITLARAAQLARVLKHERAAALDRRMIEVLQTWARFRTAQYHTEGTTYDGYLMDSVTDWLRALPNARALQTECRDAFRSLVDQWVHLTLPGRLDLHVPIGDVEPEMPFWMTVVGRAGAWYGLGEASWLLSRVNLERLPAAALIEATQPRSVLATAPVAPTAAAREHPHVVSLRTGWRANDAAAFVSVSRNPMSHLHSDAGQVVLGWHGRFWITDPGYQQYRPGDEREYSIGPQAHNPPVINGAAQKAHAAKLEATATQPGGTHYTRVALAACYPGLPKDSVVTREVWLSATPDCVVAVRDDFAGLEANADIATNWLGGDHFAWAFVDGWARLSDGTRAVWLGTPEGRLEPTALTRHTGSRGPLTLVHHAKLTGTNGMRWWVICGDEAGGWRPPGVTAKQDRLQVTLPGGANQVLTFAR